MKNYIKNNPFLFFIIIVMWIFYIGVSLSEKGFFIKYATEPIGTTIFFIGIGAVITTNKEKRKKKKEINQQEIKEIDENEENDIKKSKANKGKIFFKRYIMSLSILAIIITSVIFYIRKLEFSFYDFFIMVIGYILIEIVVCGVIWIVIETAIDYRKDCKKYGVLKATIWLVVLILMVALFIYNKDAKLFR